MTAQSWSAPLPVLLLAASIWVTPALTRPTVPFGVRVPADRADAPVIQRERRSYRWRTAVLGVCFTATAALPDPGSGWLVVVVTLQLATGLGCFLLARERVTAVKTTQGWFEGLIQTVATDTSWRTEPERFPVLWLLPAAAVTAVTAIVGVIRYPRLPARLAVHFTAAGAPDRWAATSLRVAFSVVAAQLFTTALITGLLLLIYRSRPDTDAADVAGSTRRYRAFLTVTARALLALTALADLGLLLTALQIWQVYRLTGAAAALPVLPVALGVLVLLGVAVRTGQAGAQLSAPTRDPGREGVVNRDDDRFWKLGLIYLNRQDPALMVTKRFGVGWTLNFANPKAWLLIAGMAAAAAGLSAWRG